MILITEAAATASPRITKIKNLLLMNLKSACLLNPQISKRFIK
jgi:hypothetical protein